MAGTRISLKDLNLTPYISTGSAVAYNISIERITAYSDKETFFIDFHVTCGDAPTLNINGLGAKNITIGGVNLSTGQVLSNSGYFVKYSLSLDKFIIIGGGCGSTMNCADVKDCIENFTDLDLSNLDALILGGLGTDIYINGSTIHYDSVTENRSGDSTINLQEGASITNNLDGTVNNNYGDTYEENNNYEDGSTFNHTGDVTNNYEDYTENNEYGDNVEINNNYSSDTVINHNGGTHNYSSDTEVNFEGDTNIENLNVTNLNINGGNIVVNVATDKDDQIYNGTDLDWTLPSTPLSEDALHITTDSGTNLILGIDYSVSNNIITWIIQPNAGEHLYARWLRGQANTVPGGQAYYEEYVAIGGETDIVLSNTPAGANWIRVSTESSLYGKQGATRDWTYDAGTNTITMNYTLQAGDVISIQYIGFVAMPDQGYVNPIEDTTGTISANANDYIVVTYTGGPTIINLPDANTCNGGQIRVKKFTGEDVLTTTILPYGTQLIDGYTGATMNINRTMYTFTAINGNWYLGD